MNHGFKINGNILEITLPDGIDIEKVVVNGQEYISYSDHDIQTMQDLESAQIDKAYELGKESKKGKWKINDEWVNTCSECGIGWNKVFLPDSWNYCPNCGARMEADK